MARAADRDIALALAGRTAQRAVTDALGVTSPRDPLGKLLAETPAVVRDAIGRLIAQAGFVLAATARGLASSPPERLLESWFRPVLALPDLMGELRAAALRALSNAAGVEFQTLGADELGRLYEGTLGASLELAREPIAVVSLRKRAGGAATELALSLADLLGQPSAARGDYLGALGVALESKARAAVSRARNVEELGGALARSRLARGRLVSEGRVALLLSADRRRSGSHYTSGPIAERVVESALGPLVVREAGADQLLDLRICDPAMGTGAFVAAACRFLGERLLAAEGSVPSNGDVVAARRRVAERCLFGIDRDPVAVEVARLSLWLAVGDPTLSLDFADRALRTGEALLGPPDAGSGAPPPDAFDWLAEFSAVCVERGGFDAFVGNPPWVSYVGRAAQPLAVELRSAYARYESFAGYKNLQGLFVERSARLVRTGGRLGLLLPSSMSELQGYSPTRRAHDRYCEPDGALTDLGDAGFADVFQPCMVLASTRRAAPLAEVVERPWPMERPDLDALARALIEKLAGSPLPPHLFGERGLQSMGDDVRHLAAAPDERHSVPLRTGSDVSPFRLRAPSLFADPSWFGARLRPAEEWSRVRFVVRQTARAPLAALSDGVAFRNSLLAGFEDDDYPASFLIAYLNSSPIRWLHYVRHRDARQGLPQLKVMHLRTTPAPPRRALVEDLARLGSELSRRQGSMAPEAQAELDTLVADAFRLSRRERERIAEARPLIGC